MSTVAKVHSHLIPVLREYLIICFRSIVLNNYSNLVSTGLNRTLNKVFLTVANCSFLRLKEESGGKKMREGMKKREGGMNITVETVLNDHPLLSGQLSHLENYVP